MAKVKVFTSIFDKATEQTVNKWIAEAEGRGAKVIQIAASESGGLISGYTLWALYEEQGH
jgi:hypothetical protein